MIATAFPIARAVVNDAPTGTETITIIEVASRVFGAADFGFTVEDGRPHFDGVSAHAAWTLSQLLALRLVKDGGLTRSEAQEGLNEAIIAS